MENGVSLGRFRLDIDRRQLSCDGQPVKLGSRALDILCVLAAAKGELVTKDALMAAVWPGVVVEENNIEVQISALRRCLGDHDAAQKCVVTIPGRGYRLLASAPPPLINQSTSERRTALPGTSIAVLPFENMSGDPDQDYFVDGIVEEIITGLSRVKSLFVIARNSTLIYKGRAVDVKQVGRELGVRYVLEGSVRKVANRVRFTAQLVETENGIHIWAERYDRLLDDIFVVQDDIAMSVVAVIEPGLRKIEIERVQRKRTDNLDAYDLVLRSMPFVYTFVPQHADVAIPLLQKALELEPGYASSHAGLAWCFHFRFVRGGRREEDRITSTRHARAAVAAGADDATTLATAGIVIFFNEHDVTTAFELFDRALAVSPSNVIALGMSAVALAWIGNPDLAIERAHRALQLNPFEPMGHVPELALSAAYFQTGRYEEARRAAQRASDANPNYGAPQAYLAAALVPLGHLEEARKRAQRARELDPTFTIRTAALMRKFVPEVFAPFADAWRKAGIPDD